MVYLVCCLYGLILVTVKAKKKKRLISFCFISNLLFSNSPFFMRLNLLNGGFQELNSCGGRDYYSTTHRNILQATYIYISK